MERFDHSPMEGIEYYDDEQPSVPPTNSTVNPTPSFSPFGFSPMEGKRLSTPPPTFSPFGFSPMEGKQLSTPPPSFSPFGFSPMDGKQLSTPPNNSTGNPPPTFSIFSSQFVSPVEGKQLSTPQESLPCKLISHEALPRIEINMKLATHILLDEARKGSISKNVVCSPLSIEFALQAVAAGSKGETLKQILQFIGFKGNQLDSMEDLNLKSYNVMRVASSYSKEPELSFANGIWVDWCYKLKPSYKELMSSIYNARAETVDFKKQADELIVDINSWVADKTKGLIEKILAPRSIDKDTMLIIVNALYFKGLWEVNSKFNKNITIDKDFYMLDGSKITVPFMSRHSPEYRYRAFDGFSVLQLDYKRGDDYLRRFCMQILLPDERDGLQNLIDKCISDPGLLNQDFGLKSEKFKELRVPKFKFTYMHNDLVDLMKTLGLTLPFELNCSDFTEMVELPPGEKIRVSKIAHKATIEVNESSTEAAAATVVQFAMFGSCSMNLEPLPTLRFVADHPFMFVIKEVNTGAVFFIGAVFNPLLND